MTIMKKNKNIDRRTKNIIHLSDGSEDGIRAACTKGRMIREMAHQL